MSIRENPAPYWALAPELGSAQQFEFDHWLLVRRITSRDGSGNVILD